MNKYITEFIGTFFLVLVIAFTGNPLAIGAVLTALVYMGGYISGAHYNPAVTFGLVVSKKLKFTIAIRYILAQFAGSIAASLVYLVISDKYFIPAPAKNVTLPSALLIETLFTFLLVTVILHVAATNKTKGNHYFGLAIGFTVMAGAFAAGPISGAAFNPAVGIGPLLIDFNHLADHGMSFIAYLVGPLAGAYLASIVYQMKQS